jgi:hypothetical protein
MTRQEIEAFQEREFGAMMIAAAFLLALPAALFLVMLYVTAMLVVFGDHNAHGQVWGWLSHHQSYGPYTDDKGVHHSSHTEWTENYVPLKYLMGVVSCYIAYQIGEGLFQSGRAFARMLAK